MANLMTDGGAPAPRCNCHRGSTCDISHDPAACSCAQCVAAEGKENPKGTVAATVGGRTTQTPPEAQEDPVPCQERVNMT
jgi:hypothetical protein